MQRFRAFTLVEMLMVVAVVGVGGALALSAMSDQIAEARARSELYRTLNELKSFIRESREQMNAACISNHNFFAVPLPPPNLAVALDFIPPQPPPAIINGVQITTNSPDGVCVLPNGIFRLNNDDNGRLEPGGSITISSAAAKISLAISMASSGVLVVDKQRL